MKNLRVCVAGVFQRGANWNARGVPDKSTGRIAKEYSGARGSAELGDLSGDWRRNIVRAYIDCHGIFHLLKIKLNRIICRRGCGVPLGEPPLGWDIVGRDRRVFGRMDTWKAAREVLDALRDQSTRPGALPPDPRLVSLQRRLAGIAGSNIGWTRTVLAWSGVVTEAVVKSAIPLLTALKYSIETQ